MDSTISLCKDIIDNHIGANPPETPGTVPNLKHLFRVPPRNENLTLLSRNSMNSQANIGSQGSRKANELPQVYGNDLELLQMRLNIKLYRFSHLCTSGDYKF